MPRTPKKTASLKRTELGDFQVASAPRRTPGPLIGHGAQTAFLERAQTSDRTAHAYLFVGPEHVGKTSAALDFAGRLLGTDKPESHADFSFLERERDLKTGRLHGTIVIDQVRALIGRLNLGSFLGGTKIAVMEGAQLLTPDAANALLKTLEEPSGRSVIILTAPSEESVIATIRSRCQTLRFGRVSNDEIKSGLEKRGIDAATAAACARLSGGLPGLAVLFASDPEALQAARALRATLLDMPKRSIAERWSALDKLLPSKLPFQEAQDRAEEISDAVAELVHDALAISSVKPIPLVSMESGEQVAAWSQAAGRVGLAVLGDAVTETRHLLDSNVSPRTALERLLLSF